MTADSRHISDVTVSAYDDDQARLDRLRMTLGYVVAMMDVNGAGSISKKVIEVHDHKGFLEVYWSVKPDDLERHVFHLAWNSEAGDGADNVEHFLNEERIG